MASLYCPPLTVEKRPLAVFLDPPKFECFYSVFPDGAYYSYYDIPRNTMQKYKRLRVYSDNLR